MSLRLPSLITRPHLGVVIAIVAALAFAAASHLANAITITMEYTDEGSPTPHPENPSWDPAGTVLKAHFNAAAAIWSQLLLGPGEFEFDFHWDDDIDSDPNDGKLTLGLTTDAGLDMFIEINPNANWYADPTPTTDDEFATAGTQKLFSGLSAGEKSLYFPSAAATPGALETRFFRNGISTAIGAGGYDSKTGFDLLTVVMHEIGHALGIDGNIPNLYTIAPQHIGGVDGVLVLGGDGGHLAGNASTPGFLMCDGCAFPGARVYPTATDVLVAASENDISTVHLARVGSIGAGSWGVANNWIGGAVPDATQDVYVRTGDVVVLDADRQTKNLLVNDGSGVLVLDHSLYVKETLNFNGGSLSVGSNGKIEADTMVRGSADPTTSAGSLVRFNGYENSDGGTTATAHFNGGVAIGSGLPTGTTPTFDPSTIATWTIAEKLSIGDLGRSANLVINGGADFTSATGQLGSSSPGGTAGNVTIDGMGSTWTIPGAFDVYRGSLLVKNKARLESGPVNFATSGGLANATVNDADWFVEGDAFVGPSSLTGDVQGTLTIENDGNLRVDGNLTIRGTSTRTSEIEVQSVGLLEVDGNVAVGPYGMLTFRDETKAFAGILGAATIANLGSADSAAGGITRFFNDAKVGSAHITNHPGGSIFAGNGHTEFHDNASADLGQIDNLPGVVSYFSGMTRFYDFAEAGGAHFYNHPGSLASFATVEFNGDSNGANGTFTNLPGVLSQSVGGQIVFRDRAKAGHGTYSNEGEGGTIVFNNDSSAEFGTFSTAHNVGGNSSIQFFNTAKGDHGTFTIRTNTSLQFLDSSNAQNATITLTGPNPLYGGYGGLLSVSGGTLGDATITAEGAATTGYYGGSIVLQNPTATAGQATITVLGGVAFNAGGGTLRFDYSSSAGTANITAFGGATQGLGGVVEFARGASGATSNVTINAGAVLDVGGNRLNGGTSIGALQGAGQFVLGGSLLATGGLNLDSTIAGVISNGNNPDGQLFKFGSGTLTLAGNNTYTGLTTVSGGALSITGSIPADAVVNNGATLEGTGVIGGVVTVNSGGIFAPGTSPGTITVGGLQMMPGGHLQFELSATRDHIVVNGNVSLGGILDLSLLSGFVPELHQSFPLFEGSVGSITGTFATVNSPIFDGHAIGVIYGVNSVTLQVVDAISPTGDYNGNGVVDAADYVVWRKGLGTIYTPTHYDIWRAHFGQLAGSAASLASVPEPASLTLLAFAFLAVATICRNEKTARL